MRIQEGDGWRLVVDPARSPFPVLIGGNGWATELTLAEAALLRRGVMSLVEQHGDLMGGLMAEEALTLEFEAALATDPTGPGTVASIVFLLMPLLIALVLRRRRSST